MLKILNKVVTSLPTSTWLWQNKFKGRIHFYAVIYQHHQNLPLFWWGGWHNKNRKTPLRSTLIYRATFQLIQWTPISTLTSGWKKLTMYQMHLVAYIKRSLVWVALNSDYIICSKVWRINKKPITKIWIRNIWILNKAKTIKTINKIIRRLMIQRVKGDSIDHPFKLTSVASSKNKINHSKTSLKGSILNFWMNVLP